MNTQLGLWRSPAPAATLRYYQTEAVFAAAQAFETHRKVLIEMATSGGKTTVFAEVARLWPGKVLILAHRDELIGQAKARLESHCNEPVGVEQADSYAEGERIVVGSFDTVRQPKRMARMLRCGFGLCIIDECHHVVSRTYLAVARALEAAGSYILGVTATPDRGDKRALGIAFDHVAYRFGINEGVNSGYISPVIGARVGAAVDLSQVTSVAGDLNQGELDEVMLKAVEGIVKTTLEKWPDRKGIGFFPGVKSAELAAARFNELKPGSAAFVCGSTPEDKRREIVADVKRGKYQYLTNCSVAIEGWDWPECSLVIGGRPTKSRLLAAQMAGRGVRVLPGVVDHIHGREGAEERRRAIARSAKPDCVIADFVGNSGKHSLAGVEDVLGGDYTEAEKAKAKELTKNQQVDTMKALNQAREELRRLAASVRSKVSAKVEVFNPLQVFHCSIAPSEMHGPRATKGQVDGMVKIGVPEKDALAMSKAAASKFFRAAGKRRDLGLATYKQLALLKRYGVDSPNIRVEKATQAIDYIASCKWSVNNIDASKLAQIVGK